MKDYYKILGVEEGASEEEIQARWIELKDEYQRALGEGEEFDEGIKEINQAYQVLKDPSLRLEYDLERDFKRAILKRTRVRQKQRLDMKKVVLSISVLFILIILGSLIFRRGEVPIQPKEMEKGILQESAKLVPKPTPSRPSKKESKPFEKPSVPKVSKPEASVGVVKESQKIVAKKMEETEKTKPLAKEPLTAKPETLAKVEAPKEASKGIAQERPEIASKETKKVVIQESPKIVSKEPEKVEETKPTAIEPSPVKKNEGLTKSEQVVPREVSKVVPQEVVKVEEPKPTAKESPPPVAKPATPAPSIASIPFTKEEEVRHFFANYVERYNRKDIEGFLSLFSSKVLQNQKDGLKEIRKVYTQFFNQSQELQYRMEDMKIEMHQNDVEVKAQYELRQLPKKGKEEKIYRGSIHWVLVKEDERLKVHFLDYQRESSP